MRILLTGGTGLIGSTLVPMLRKAEHDVITLQRYEAHKELRAPSVIYCDIKDGRCSQGGVRGVA